MSSARSGFPLPPLCLYLYSWIVQFRIRIWVPGIDITLPKKESLCLTSYLSMVTEALLWVLNFRSNAHSRPLVWYTHLSYHCRMLGNVEALPSVAFENCLPSKTQENISEECRNGRGESEWSLVDGRHVQCTSTHTYSMETTLAGSHPKLSPCLQTDAAAGLLRFSGRHGDLLWITHELCSQGGISFTSHLTLFFCYSFRLSFLWFWFVPKLPEEG